jgi:hypothetical protein
MGADSDGKRGSDLEAWEKEVLAEHRWGKPGGRAAAEHERLRRMWEGIQPVDDPCRGVIDQIVALEICNWNLEGNILTLCKAIAAKHPAAEPIGHMLSFPEERWKKAWAYYLACRDWLSDRMHAASGQKLSGYETLLRMCDPDKTIRDHVSGLLGDKNELKKLYVERFCLCLEHSLGGIPSRGSAQVKAHVAAVSAIEEEIRKRDPQGRILDRAYHLAEEGGYGGLFLCHHKVFRRFDIILSSISAGQWRATMPMRGTDGFERAATIEKYVAPIESWIEGGTPAGDERGEPGDRIYTLLGEPDETKVFLASLLVSLLRSQQVDAKARAEKRRKMS